MRLRRVIWNPWQSNGKLRNRKNQSFEVLCHKQNPECKEGKQREICHEAFFYDSHFSHFWSTSRSPFSTCYIPFQSSGSQESNTLNGVRFGIETKELQPLEAKHRKLKANFAALRNQPFAAK